MSISTVYLDLPSKLDEILNFSINFDGLKKIIEFLQNNSKILANSIKDFNKRISAFESLKNDMEEIKIKSLNIEKTNDELNKSYINLNDKILYLENKLNDLSKKSEQNSETLNKQMDMLYNHDQNIKDLIKGEEEKNQVFNEIKENYEIFKKKIDVNVSKINELENKNNEAMDLIKNNTESLDREKKILNQRIDITKKDISSLYITINEIKNNDYLRIKEYIKSNKPNSSYKKNKAIRSLEFAFMEENEHNNNNTFMDEFEDINKINNTIEKEKKKFNKFYEEYKINQKKLNEENNINKKAIKEIQSNIDNINIRIKNILYENNDANFLASKLKSINKDSDFLSSEAYKKMNDNIKLLTVSINTKPNRDDFEALKRNLELRLKKLELIQNSSLDSKRSNSIELKDNKENINSLEYKNIGNIIDKIQASINEKIQPLIKDSLLEYGKNIDISNNIVILEMMKTNKKNFEDINQKILMTSGIKTQINGELEEKVGMLNEQVLKLYQNNNINNIKLNEIIHEIEGSDNEEEDEDYKRNKLNEGTIKERLSRLSDMIYKIKDKTAVLEKKNLSFGKEVKDDVKSHLKNETMKIVEQFKTKLNLFTHKFEEELKNKIDQIGLYTFERKMNSKLLYELKDKLDKNELKKNNNLINRKIDSLENKISKTLVDTIIDLQMDEAPLIAKKNQHNFEICASCNQIVKKNTSINSDNTLSPNKSQSNNKFKIKSPKYNGINIQTINLKTSLSSPKYLPDININNS